jgi:hypothetical protein
MVFLNFFGLVNGLWPFTSPLGVRFLYYLFLTMVLRLANLGTNLFVGKCTNVFVTTKCFYEFFRK